MKIQLSPLTIQRLQISLGHRPGYLKLFNDTQDCGCNGMLVIQIVDEPYRTDLVVDAEPFTFLIDRQQADLFEDTMRIEADPNYPSYKLVSDSTLYTSNLKVRDMRSS